MKRPLAGLVIVYAAGIWLGSLVNWPVSWLWGVTATLLVAVGLLSRSRFSLPVLLVLVGVTGLLTERLALTALAPDNIVSVVESRDQSATLRGTIVSDPGQTEERRNFKLDLTALQTHGPWQPVSGRVLVFVSDENAGPPLRYGDVVETAVLLRVPPVARNPGGFNWRAWLARQQIGFTATIRKDDRYAVLAHDQGNPVTALSLRLREQFAHALQAGLEDEPQLAGVLAGMVIGARSEIPPDTYDDFQRTGVFHVFAINGLHVGLVTVILLVLLRLLRIPRRWCALAAIPLLVLYVFATGAHPGAVRALVMACVWLLGWTLVRPCDSLNNLAAAALVLLVWDPTQLFDGGFRLSFTVVVAIVVLTPRIERVLLPLVLPDPLVPTGLVPRWRVALGEPLQWGVRLLSCSVAAWVGLAPLLAVYFHLFTPISIVANLLVIPLLSGVIALGLLATLAFGVWPGLALILNNANFFLLNVMTRGVDWLGRIPGSHWYVQAPPVWLTIAYYTAGILLLNRWWRGALAVGAAAALALAWQAWTAPFAEITVLDLNDGAAIFINLPGETDDILIDGGGDWGGRREVLPFLRAQGVDRLPHVVVTRGDKAHVAGLGAVATAIPVGRVISSGVATRSKYNDQWLRLVATNRWTVQSLRAGAEFQAGRRLKVRVLNPPADITANRSDDNALVLLLDFGATRGLAMSDAGATVERHLLNSGQDLRADFILKGRHSDELSCTEEFLDAVHPRVVVQSVSLRPSQRYAEPELRPRLQRRGIQLVRTDTAGAVTISLTKTGATVRTCLAGN